MLFTGDSTPDWPYYSILHEILGQRDVCNNDLLEDSLIDNELDNNASKYVYYNYNVVIQYFYDIYWLQSKFLLFLINLIKFTYVENNDKFEKNWQCVWLWYRIKLLVNSTLLLLI